MSSEASIRERAIRDHQAWLGYLQPDGLVVSPAALVDAQVVLDTRAIDTQQKFEPFVETIEDAEDDRHLKVIRNIPAFCRGFLGWPEDLLFGADASRPIPESLIVLLAELGETLEPTYALKDHRAKEPKLGEQPQPWLLLIKVLETGADLDTVTTGDQASWSASVTRRFERLLRETRVPIGLLVNGTHIRFVYAPRGENSGSLTFPVAAMSEVAGRPILAALHGLLGQDCLIAGPTETRLPNLLQRSRDYQSTVSTELAQQVIGAAFDLLRGFQAAHERTNGELLNDVLATAPNKVYEGLLTVLMRCVFLLYAEDRGLMPGGSLYQQNYSVHGLFERLRADHERYPDTMESRYGAWAQLLALFRAIHGGCDHPSMKLPARAGYLFDPERFPFLEGRPTSSSPPSRLPLVPDGTIFRVLRGLLILKGERLSYRTLDVEQIGSVYEVMMGFGVGIAAGPSIAIKPKKTHGAPVPINLEELLTQPANDRAKWLKAKTDQELSDKPGAALKAAKSVDDLLAAMEQGKKIQRSATPSPVPAGAMLLVPSDERRRSGSNYTPRSLTEPIVRKTLEPILRRLGVGDGEWGKTGDSNGRSDSIVSGSAGVAVGNGPRGSVLRGNKGTSTGGDVRTDKPDSAGSVSNPGQHRGGTRPGQQEGVPPVPPGGTGQSSRVGDAHSALAPRRVHAGSISPAPSHDSRPTRSHVAGTPEVSSPSTPTPHILTPNSLSLGPTPDQILDLKVCDPAMGSGAFLVEACRQLAEELVRAWHAHGQLPREIPPDEDELLYAKRLIAQRCLYGVDKNPMAADLAKLSMWLTTLARDHPFTFLDHSFRAGDSLVGLTRAQIEDFSWQATAGKQKQFYAKVIGERIEAALTARRAILDGGDHLNPATKHDKLEKAEEQLGLVRFIGDLAVAAFFAGEKEKQRKEKRQEFLQQLTAYLGDRSRLGSGVGGAAGDISRRPQIPVDALKTGDKGVTPFHWEIEFPEVFGRENQGFDAIVGNPPFAGRTTLAEGSHAQFVDWLQALHPGSHGNADLVAHFFRRAFGLIRRDGCFGLIATNTIGQGDTRSTGLRVICTTGGSIYASRCRHRWPGEAAVVVSVVHVCKAPWHDVRDLDGQPVTHITAYLFHSGGNEDPMPLRANWRRSFQGSVVVGVGFTFDDADTKGLASPESLMRELTASNPRNAERIFPYIGGDEINETPSQLHQRYVINFGDLSEEEARRGWPDLMKIVEVNVKPERQSRGAGGSTDKARRAKTWWQFARPARELYKAIADQETVFACSQTSKYFGIARLPNGMVYSHKTVVFAFEAFAPFATLQSRVHQEWADFFGSSLEDRPVYTSTDCFETFPFPEGFETDPRLEAAGKAYYEFRAALMVRNNEGLTKTYNRFHDPEEPTPHGRDILKLRDLHAAMDRAVLDAYGWTDIPTDCEFLLDYEEEDEGDGSGESAVGSRGRKKRKPYRYRWPDAVRDEVLARLLALNAKRAEEERLSGLAAEAAAGKGKRGAKKPGAKRLKDAAGQMALGESGGTA